MNNPDIFSYIKGQEAIFETQKVRLGDNWEWSFRDHVQLIFHLKNGIFFTGENDWLRAFKNIMEPMLNLAYWTEDIEVKDVVFYIEGKEGRVLSFLIKKYHDEVYVKEHDLDMLFDEITESDLDYGGVIVQKGKKRPEILPLISVAFCDQTDILGGALGVKHFFSPDKLRKMKAFGWGNEANGATISIEDLIVLADDQKDPGTRQDSKNQVPSKSIEVYIVRGNLPEHYLKDNDNLEDWYNQLQIVAFYTDKNKKKQGVTLYRRKDAESNIMFHTSKKVENRALGRGVGESLLHPQIWTNFLTIHKMNFLEASSKVPLFTDDPAYANRNKIQEMDNLEITTIDPKSKFGIQQVPTASPANIQVIGNAVNEWYEHAQLTGSAFDPVLGKDPVSGTTFRGQERTIAQGRGIHDRRRGQRAKFIEQIYRNWIIPEIVREIVDGKKFLATLTPEELSWVSEQLTTNHVNKKIKRAVIDGGKIPTNEEIAQMKDLFKTNFSKQGNKKMVEIMKGEFEDIEVRMGINVANKQKDLSLLSDKLLSIFQFVFSNPQGFQQAMQIPALAESFQDILEFSGLNQANFLSLTTPPTQQMALPEGQTQQEPMQLNRPVEA